MAVLRRRRSRRGALFAIVVVSGLLSLPSCSFLIDTDSLQSGEDAGTTSKCEKPDSASDACRDCIAKDCCPQLTRCIQYAPCFQALGTFYTCRTTTSATTCFNTFIGSGVRASELGSCGLQNCGGACGG